MIDFLYSKHMQGLFYRYSLGVAKGDVFDEVLAAIVGWVEHSETQRSWGYS